jgi:peptidoglycan/LPS O-acetylase OafA/YrhL
MSRTVPRIADLDALRGLAALAVVLFHYTSRYQELYGHASPVWLEVPWGHHGVELFFAISGFVIFMTLDRCRRLTDFAVSRASRLYPAYWAAIALTTLILAVASRTDLLRSPAEIAINLTMTQSFLRVDSVDGVYWTLSVELAFYCAAALLWRLGLLRRIEPILLAWMALKWLWTFSRPLLGFEPSWLLGALLIEQYIPYFALGIAAWRLRSGAASPRAAGMLVAASLATVAACDGAEYLLVAVISGGAIFGVALARVPLIGARPLLWLGAVSYSLYLLHQYIGFSLIARLEASGLDANAAIALTLTALLALATAVTRWVEQPALRAIRRWHAARGPDQPQPAAIAPAE